MKVHAQAATGTDPVDAPYSWLRLAISVLIGTIGGVGMWAVVVVLPLVQAEFGAARGAASLPFTVTMIAFAGSGILMGRIVDRYGIVPPLLLGTAGILFGYLATAASPNLTVFIIAHGGLVGLGAAAFFAPLMSDVSHWFVQRRGIAVAICASGNYFAGAVWPPIIQFLATSYGWRTTLVGIGLFCALTLPPLIFLLRRRRLTPPAAAAPTKLAASGGGTTAMRPNTLQALLALAGIACCVAMSMPQVHIVAYCADLGYGVARGAEMLSLMLAAGIISRIASGWIADRIGGLRTLLLGSVLQGSALVLYLMADGLTSLYVISALFGLFQGGIVPSYAIIVREYFSPAEAGTRVGVVIMATLFGMALGGWMSGAIFDLTGSYAAAFTNGIAWNLVNVAIVLFLIVSLRPRYATA